MSYSPTMHDHIGSSLRHRIVPATIATVVAAVAFTALGVFGDPREPANVPEFLVVCGFIIVAAGIVFGLVVPRRMGPENVGTTALTLSVLGALLALPVFWAGVPAVLGAGGAFLGWDGRSAVRGSGRAQAAFVLGLLTLVAWIAVYLLDWMNGNNII